MSQYLYLFMELKFAELFQDNVGWIMNYAGFWFNTRFGFGLMNADSLVKSATDWVTVPEKYIYSTSSLEK